MLQLGASSTNHDLEIVPFAQCTFDRHAQRSFQLHVIPKTTQFGHENWREQPLQEGLDSGGTK